MWKEKLVTFAFLFVLLLGTVAADGSVILITHRSDLNESNELDWDYFGPPFTQIPQDFQFNFGLFAVDGSFATGPGERLDEGNGWTGNFAIGDRLAWTNANGPLTFTFFDPVQGAGAQIETSSFGAFTAQIKAFDGDTLLGAFLENGNSQPTEDGSAIFIGVKDEVRDITSIEFSILSCTGDCSDFAINLVSIRTFIPPDVPEPASLLLLSSAFLAVIGNVRKRSARIGRKRLGAFLT